MLESKPEIKIGIVKDKNLSTSEEFVNEIALGIEEEGCLYDIYETDLLKNINYGNTGVCILVSSRSAKLYVSDYKENYPLYSIDFVKLITTNEYNNILRNMGKNAARYIKKKVLIADNWLLKH